MLLWIIRALFLLVWAGTAGSLTWQFNLPALPATVLFIAVLLLGAGAIAIDVIIRRKRIEVLSAIFIGLLVGITISWFITLAGAPFVQLFENSVLRSLKEEVRGAIAAGSGLLVTSIVCYLCISFLLQTKDDFRFIIPYVEFSKETKGNRPLVLDTSVIIDGRIADLAETRLFDNPLVVPGFVLQELQQVADSTDKLKRNRGRRGLDVLNKLRTLENVDLHTNEIELPEFHNVRNVDQKLLLLAKHLDAKVVTNDFNLNKLARLQGIHVVNLNDIANALKPVVLPGETMLVRITKPGDQPGQGVGYLDDGTMVVAEQGRSFLGEEVKLIVTSVLQTSAGRMIFGRIASAA